jgi:NAD-dependent deacetylase
MDIHEISRWIANAGRIVGFSGAGISTESGIPDFRTPGGIWSTNRIIDFEEYCSSRSARVESWKQKFAIWPAMRDAQPNAGHHAFVELERQGKLIAMITQNIDGLHQRAGQSSDLMIELHGTMVDAQCLTCGDRTPMDVVLDRVSSGDESPECHDCGGLLKPATISFGQAMPAREMERAMGACMECDLLIAVGSSLVVHPAAALPLLAKHHGARLVIVNRTATPLDDMADAVVRDEIGAVMPVLACVGLCWPVLACVD